MHFATSNDKCCSKIKKIVVSLSQFPRYNSSSAELSSRFSSCDSHEIYKSASLQHWYKNWNELRKNKLTASTFGQAVGFWPKRRVQLWLEKIGAVQPFWGNDATAWTNIKEQEALVRYKLITGNPISFTNFNVYREMIKGVDWLGASPDGVVDKFVYHLPSRGVLEIKCPYFNGDMTKATPWKRIPIYYVPQAQGLMEILDRDWMDYYVWTTKGSSLFRMHRDEEYWQLLKIALSDFWWNHVHFKGPIRGRHDGVRHHPYSRPIQSSLQALAGGSSGYSGHNSEQTSREVESPWFFILTRTGHRGLQREENPNGCPTSPSLNKDVMENQQRI
ncbi:uncharacterized protein LOC132061245 [Lycium ferocissimum]|uniref:uncharacterized protein LOC132061245 n=1 Tax=Lycium ferocissimum TaxID=112874 RepID=UPI002814BD38|nr:uncharacterized protein LOC132061245 [Lycium ferocissimum]